MFLGARKKLKFINGDPSSKTVRIMMIGCRIIAL